MQLFTSHFQKQGNTAYLSIKNVQYWELFVSEVRNFSVGFQKTCHGEECSSCTYLDLLNLIYCCTKQFPPSFQIKVQLDLEIISAVSSKIKTTAAPLGARCKKEVYFPTHRVLFQHCFTVGSTLTFGIIYYFPLLTFNQVQYFLFVIQR